MMDGFMEAHRTLIEGHISLSSHSQLIHLRHLEIVGPIFTMRLIKMIAHATTVRVQQQAAQSSRTVELHPCGIRH